MPSSFIASAARARPGPIAAASVVPVTGPSKRRTEPSGRVMAGMVAGSASIQGGGLWRHGSAAATLSTGRSARSGARSTWASRRPGSAARSGPGRSSAENSTTQGQPMAAARCIGPVSLPTATRRGRRGRRYRRARSGRSGRASRGQDAAMVAGERGFAPACRARPGVRPRAVELPAPAPRSARPAIACAGRCGAAPGTSSAERGREIGDRPRLRSARHRSGGGNARDPGHLQLLALALARVHEVAPGIGVRMRAAGRDPRPGRPSGQPEIARRPRRGLQVVDEIEPAQRPRQPQRGPAGPTSGGR